MTCNINCAFYENRIISISQFRYDVKLYCDITKIEERDIKVCPLDSKVNLENNIWELLRTELGY